MIVTEAIRLQYAGLYLLRLLRADKQDAAQLIKEGEVLLEPVLEWLVQQNYASVNSAGELKVSAQGAAVAASFEKRYQQFIQKYDVFCAVDLEEGTFAFEAYDEFSDRDDWDEYLDRECFDDLRVAIAQFEGIDPVEIIVMSFIQEGRFGYTEDGWNEDLLLGSVWEEVADACADAVQLDELAFEGDDGPVTAEVVAADVLEQGQEVMRGLKR